MLNIIDVHKTFNKGTVNEKKALDGIDLHLNPGDFVTVIGGNGAGKSTMLNMIAGVYPIDQGTILLDGKDISDLPEHKRAYAWACVPGPYDGNRSRHGNSGEYGHGSPPWEEPRPALGHYKEREKDV